MHLRWSHCVLYVRNLDEMVSFYTKVLGFQVTDSGVLRVTAEAKAVVVGDHAGMVIDALRTANPIVLHCMSY